MAAGTKQFKAELSARLYLEMRGYETIEFNYRRSRYKIDLIERKEDHIFFVTVRIQTDSSQTFDLITPTQVAQLRLAAASWIEEVKWQGQLHYSVVEVEPESFSVLSFTDDFV